MSLSDSVLIAQPSLLSVQLSSQRRLLNAYQPLGQTVNPHRIAVEQLVALVLRNAFERALDELPGLGIGRRGVGIIRLPHNVIHPNDVPQLHPRRLVPEVHINLALEQLTRTGQNPFRPQMAPLPLMVAGLEHVIDPTEPRLRADPPQAWIAVQDTRENEVGDELRLQ